MTDTVSLDERTMISVLGTIRYWIKASLEADRPADKKLYAEQARNHVENALTAFGVKV